jgi:uncharacterized membrane protein
MTLLMRTVRLLSMVVWVGGLMFFSFMMAPTAFHVMGTTRQFALLIGSSLRELNSVGNTCGFLFLITTIALWFRSEPRSRRLMSFEAMLVVLMIAATLYVQRAILPAMERDRAAVGGDIDAAPPANPARLDFERLHPLSEKVEGAVLLFGLGIVTMMAGEPGSPRRVEL